MHKLSTQSEPDLKSTFLATIMKTQCYTTRTHPDNLGIFVSPLLESEGLKKGMSFFVSLAKGIKLQKFNDSLWFTLWYIWVLQNGFKSTGFCDVLLYITVQMYQSSCMLAGTVISALHWGPPCPLVDFCINMHHPVLISSLWMYLFLWNVLRCSSEENQKYFKKKW